MIAFHRVAVSAGAVKLAPLLKDVAEQPTQPAAAAVSLDVLQDASAKPAQPFVRKYRRGIAVILTAAILTGGAYTLLPRKRATVPVASETHVATPTKPDNNTAVPQPDHSAFSKPVQELMQYADDLKAGRVAFSANLSGEEAAKQLGYSRLFASAYEEIRLHEKKEKPDSGTDLPHVIAGFDHVVSEEQTIDKLMARKDRFTAAIAYLRALQNGDVVFPGPQSLAPVPPVLLVQLMKAYPDIKLDLNDSVFAAIYRQTRDFAASRIKETGEVWAQEIIAEFRTLIIQFADSADADTPSLCEQGTALGYVDVLVSACPELRPVESVNKAAEKIEPVKSAAECRSRARADLQSNLGAMSDDDVHELCARVRQRVLRGDIPMLNARN